MIIQFDGDEQLIRDLLNLAQAQDKKLNDVMHDALRSHLQSQTTDEELLAKAIERVTQLPNGEVFVLKDLIHDVWDQIEIPRVFGRDFRAKVEGLGLAIHTGTTSSNKAQYKRTAAPTAPGANLALHQ